MTWIASLILLLASLLGASLPPPPVAEIEPPERGTVYLFASAMTGVATWADFDRHGNGFTDPNGPAVANMRYYYGRLGRTAAEMAVDGVVITTPHVFPPQPDPDQWRMRMEGRLDALDCGSAMGDRAAIQEGLVHLHLQYQGRLILYAGIPDFRSPLDPPDFAGRTPNALSRDTAYREGYVKGSLGPWLDTGYFDAVCLDSQGTMWPIPVCTAVTATIGKLWPRVDRLAEPHPAWWSGHPFVGSLTTHTLASSGHITKPWNQPITPSFSPVIIAYTEPRMWTEATYAEALGRVRAGYSVGVQAWTVGWARNAAPTPVQRQRWDRFMNDVRALRVPAEPTPGE